MGLVRGIAPKIANCSITRRRLLNITGDSPNAEFDAMAAMMSPLIVPVIISDGNSIRFDVYAPCDERSFLRLDCRKCPQRAHPLKWPSPQHVCYR